jgi:2-keto-4-pentenoate hydratase/2-oxohepta-3-ene-1,7-dioic acid hydratase in catechol pathway
MRKQLYFTDGRSLQAGVMYCVGQNYAAHAKEMGSSVPSSPIIFIKPPSSIIYDGEKIILPKISNNVHYECELIVAIGKTCHNVSRSNASEYIAGYGVGIDVTMRDLQAEAKKNGHPWAIAKGFATSAPISRIVPASEVKSEFFDIEFYQNGLIRQKTNTSKMERSIPELIVFLSSIFILEEGDLIFTGTPEGVGQLSSGDKLKAVLSGYVELNVEVE